MTTLASAVSIGDNQLLIDAPMSAGQIPGYVKIDSELLNVGGQHFRTGTTLVLTDPATATHSQGATVTYAGRPYDAAFLAATAGAGSGSLTLDDTVDPPAEVATLIAPGAVIDGSEATLGKWTAVGATDETVDLSTSVTVSGSLGVGKLNRTVIGTDSAAGTEANTTVTSDGDGEANTTVTLTGIEDGLATTTVNTVSGSADVSIAAHATDVAAGNAFASSNATSVAGNAQAKSTADAATTGTGDATSEASTADGAAIVSSIAYASGSGNATVNNDAVVDGAGLATAGISATGTGGTSGVVALADATSARLGFNGATPIAKPTGVAVTAEAIHAALVSLGLIAA